MSRCCIPGWGRSRLNVNDITWGPFNFTIRDCALFLLHLLLVEQQISFQAFNEFFLFAPDSFRFFEIFIQLLSLLLQLLTLCLHLLKLLIALSLLKLLDLLFKVNIQSSLSDELILQDLDLVKSRSPLQVRHVAFNWGGQTVLPVETASPWAGASSAVLRGVGADKWLIATKVVVGLPSHRLLAVWALARTSLLLLCLWWTLVVVSPILGSSIWDCSLIYLALWILRLFICFYGFLHCLQWISLILRTNSSWLIGVTDSYISNDVCLFLWWLSDWILCDARLFSIVWNDQKRRSLLFLIHIDKLIFKVLDLLLKWFEVVCHEIIGLILL